MPRNYLLNSALLLHIPCTRSSLRRRKNGACAASRSPYIGLALCRGRVRTHVLTTLCVASSSGNFGEGADATRAQASDDPGEHSGSNWRDQSRCLVHADLAPRRAVRRVGPRPDLTRSARTGEPCGPARLLGDGSRSSCTPYCGRPVHAAAAGRRTAGVNPLAPGNRYVDGGRPSCFGSDGLPAVFFARQSCF